MPNYLRPGVYVEEVKIGNKPIEGVGTSTAGFVGMAEKGPLNKPTLATSWAEFVATFGRYTDDQPFLAAAVSGFFANGGKRCCVVRVVNSANDCDYVGTDSGPGNKTGLQAFNDVDEVTIVSIPGVTSKTVQSAMISHCEKMKDRFCILDTTEDADLDEVETQRDNVVSEKGYAALYYPWIMVAVETLDTTSGKIKLVDKFIPPSGYVAGVFARSDIERGVHKAPANEIVQGAQGLKVAITKGKQDVLNSKGINCIRAFPGRGIRIWGDRTIASDDLWKYVNVRRLFIFLEESISKGTQWVAFDPNNEKLWAQVRQSVSAFLTLVWRDGALMGITPEEAFFVKCDRTTMTQNDVDAGKLICIIGVAPAKPAEFVIFRIAQWTAGARQ